MAETGWQLLGMAEDAPADGDFFTAMLGATPVFVQRHGTELLCFANACTHRGFPLRNTDFGNGPIRCPLHQWIFAYDGRLTEVRGCTAEDLATFDSDLPPLEMMRLGPALFGRVAESETPLDGLDELESCGSLVLRFERPAPTDETGLALGPQARLDRLDHDGRVYRMIRLTLGPKQRCWIFGEMAEVDETDRRRMSDLYER